MCSYLVAPCLYAEAFATGGLSQYCFLVLVLLLSALQWSVLALGVVEVAWFCVLLTGFGFFTFGITCDLQINDSGSLSKISAQITVKHHVLCL